MAACVLCGWLLSQAASAATLTIVVTNVAQAKGYVMVAVQAGEAGFREETPPAAAFMQPARPGEMTFIASGLAEGEYAIKVMHDVNGNEKLDTNFIGIPKEPWGMSNNARGKFGPPKWQAVKFRIEGDTTHTVALSNQ